MTHIAIDGPAASGKTSLGHALAQHFGFLFVETGKMYRAVALGLNRGLALDEVHITMNDAGRILLNNDDVSDILHTPILDQGSSRVATRPEVRQLLVRLQQEIAAGRAVVMEGRDIGTVVLPHADVKIFLQASPEERARRRASERHQAELDKTLREIITRDTRDQTRAIAPLNPASDATIIRTDNKSLAEVVSEVIALVEERLHTGDEAAK
ncbi:MAG TPA: (d)CMP kinase [Candidatus Acetothermia bacterium]|nr:(d)CMP kinase [Candidatus Acetothermia bacterium]